MPPIALLAFLLAGGSLEATGGPQVEVRFELAVAGGAAPPTSGWLVLEPSAPSAPGDELEGAGALRIPLPSGSTEMRAALPEGSRWDVAAEIPGYWMRGETLLATGAAGDRLPRRLALWPLSSLVGTIRVGQGELPREILVTTLAPRVAQRTGDRPRGALRCPVAKSGRFVCPIPAAKFDLSVAAEGQVPHYFWDIDVTVGKPRDLGLLEFVAGASLSGRIETAGGALDPQSCTVLLTAEGAADLASAEKARSAARRGRPAANGFFQLSGLSPGRYALEVRQEGFTPARLPAISVVAGQEARIGRPILLARPLIAEIAIQPPLDPFGRPWRLHALRRLEFGRGLAAETAFEGSADESGTVEFAAESGQIYDLSVADSAGQRRAAVRAIRLEGAERTHRDITIRSVAVTGLLHRGEQPLAGTLFFGLEHGEVSVRLEADERGHFQGVLPEGRTWAVEIAAADLPGRLVRKVKVDPDGDGEARVDLAIPDTRVFGRVVDDAGRPVANVGVGLVSSGELPLRSTTSTTGEFDFRGVAPGAIRLQAARGRGEAFAGPLDLEIADGQELGPVDLRLERGVPFTASVAGNAGPVAGASITVVALAPPLGLVGEGRTDPDGTLRVSLPAEVRLAELVIGPPGGALRAFVTPVSAAAPKYLVTDDVGTLLVTGLGEGDESIAITVAQDGIDVPLGPLRRWAFSHGAGPGVEPLELPGLAPAFYRVCAIPMGGGTEEVSATSCRDGHLSPGEVLELRF